MYDSGFSDNQNPFELDDGSGLAYTDMMNKDLDNFDFTGALNQPDNFEENWMLNNDLFDCGDMWPTSI